MVLVRNDGASGTFRIRPEAVSSKVKNLLSRTAGFPTEAALQPE